MLVKSASVESECDGIIKDIPVLSQSRGGVVGIQPLQYDIITLKTSKSFTNSFLERFKVPPNHYIVPRRPRLDNTWCGVTLGREVNLLCLNESGNISVTALTSLDGETLDSTFINLTLATVV
jgi:hypothetical protein